MTIKDELEKNHTTWCDKHECEKDYLVHGVMNCKQCYDGLIAYWQLKGIK